jgi:spore coat polysaccharide biosynthesis predicted glycosyltransferase SpsG
MILERVLFIPVSSSSGIGEYMRSLIIAKALEKRWPRLEIHFILNKQVSYFSKCPYIVHGCEQSPTKETAEVNRIIQTVRPELVIFDAAGRAKQFAKARAVGAKVAFISQHNKKRNRGLKLNRLLNTDVHWVAQPGYTMKPISCWQKAKLTLFNKAPPQNIGPVFELSDIDYQQQLLVSFNLTQGQYVIFNAGSGGHLIGHDLAANIYFQAAQRVASQYQVKCIMVFSDNYSEKLPQSSDVVCIKSMPNQDFISLLANAMVCVISAGDTLLQCIALKKPCVATAISPDQPARLKLCASQQLVRVAKPNIKSLVEQITTIIKESAFKAAVTHNQPRNTGLEIIIKDIDLLFNPLTKNDGYDL